MPWQNSQQILHKSLKDLLEAERQWRKRAEAENDDFRHLLEWLAYEIGGGDLLEAARREDPAAFKRWTPTEWRKLFEEVTRRGERSQWAVASSPSRPKPKPQMPKPQPQKAEKAVVAKPKPQPQPQPQPPDVVHDGKKGKDTQDTQPEPQLEPQPPQQAKAKKTKKKGQRIVHPLLGAVRAVDWNALETPSMYETVARAGGLRWRRGLYLVYLIAAQGVTSRMEIAYILSLAFNKPLSTTRAWVRRAGEFMENRNFVRAERLQMTNPKTSLSLYRLTEEGKRLAERMGWPVVESELERVERLHEGERFPAHTLGILAFAMHARLRGWSARVLPDHETATPPDVVVEKGGLRLFVEVELSNKEHVAKWRNNAKVNGGQVALVAATPERRKALVADVKRLKLHGRAADLQGYIEVPFDEAANTPLWFEEW